MCCARTIPTSEGCRSHLSAPSLAVQYERSYDVDGKSSDYQTWVRYRLSENGGRRDPVDEFGDMIANLCTGIHDRVAAVDAAIAAGIHAKAHPADLPKNIYGTVGEWETYSSPSRDARLRAEIREIHQFVNASVTTLRSGDRAWLIFDGSDRDLLAVYKKIWRANADGPCSLAYENSAGRNVMLNLDELMDRSFDLSFDPYHCPELRWGAHPDRHKTELSTCPDNAAKLKWYRDEYRLRNQIDRDYDATTTVDFGPTTSPDIHAGRLLESL